MIRFTQPEAFNDPFDSQPCFERLLSREVIEEVCGGSLPPGDGEPPDERQQRLAFQATMLNLLGQQDNKDWYLSNTVNKIAILCLAEQPDNILMWAHYADSHRGFVVGFNTEDKSIGPRNDDEKRRDLRQVTYTRDRPKAETPDDFTAHELFCTKSPDWAYEAEWRLFDAVDNADGQAADPNGNPVFLFSFDPSAIRDVILGARISDNRRNELLKILAQPEYQHVRVRQSTIDKEQYRVEILDLPRP